MPRSLGLKKWWVQGVALIFYCAIVNAASSYPNTDSLTKITSHFEPQALKAFRKLQIAADNFYSLYSDSETDMSGSARAADANEARTRASDEFQLILKYLENRNIPSFTQSDVADIEEDLNRSYKKLMATPGLDNGLSYTTIDKKGINATQRAWLKYRAAWIRFARTRYSHFDPTSLTGYLTVRRANDLHALIEIAQPSN